MTEVPQPTLDLEVKAYPKQMEFIKGREPDLAFVGGIGSGKTHSGAIKSLLYCVANAGAWGIVTAPQNRILEIATIPTYEKVFPPALIKEKRNRPHPEWKLVNGCRIFFWSTDKPETIAGAELAFGHMDEGSLSPYMGYLNIKKRLRQRTTRGTPYPYQLWITTTPRQLNWLYREIEGGRIKVYTASTLDNIYLENRWEYVESLGLSEKEYEQEIEGKFVLLTGDCLFDTQTLNARLADCFEPIETRDNGLTKIWKLPVIGGKYIAGADCADEGGGGVNDLIIMDRQTGEEVAEINGDIPADKFAYLCFQLLKEYDFPLFAPERNGTVGGIVITKMVDMGYPNLYKDNKGKYGWYTTTFANPPKIDRFTMLKEYEEAVRLRQTIIHSSDALDEMSTFVRDEGGIYKPRSGYRSDRIMARAICWQMRKHKSRESLGFTCIRRKAGTYL